MKHTATYLRRRLREMADPQVAQSMQRFSREPIRGLGVRTPDLRALAKLSAKDYRAAGLELSAIIAIADRLWRNGALEERALAIFILSSFVRRLDRSHWRHLDAWVDSLSNWAETDGLCIGLLAPLLRREPDLAVRLKKWTRSTNRWRRRAAAVALVPAARHGEQHELSYEICDRLVADRDDLVQKSIGWLLKEMSRTEPQRVASFLLDRADRFSRTTVRYACEKLPEHLRARVMSA